VEQIEKRRLSGTVLTDKGMNLPRTNAEGDVIEGNYPRESLGDVIKLDSVFVHGAPILSET
jgi:hypothetical protein